MFNTKNHKLLALTFSIIIFLFFSFNFYKYNNKRYNVNITFFEITYKDNSLKIFYDYNFDTFIQKLQTYFNKKKYDVSFSNKITVNVGIIDKKNEKKLSSEILREITAIRDKHEDLYLNFLKERKNLYENNLLKLLDKHGFKGNFKIDPIINYKINYDISLNEQISLIENNKKLGIKQIEISEIVKPKYRKIGPNTLEYFFSLVIGILFLNLLYYSLIKYIKTNFKF